MQQGVQTDATCNIQQCWELLASNVASVCTQPYIPFLLEKVHLLICIPVILLRIIVTW